jgi:hypothetical protein
MIRYSIICLLVSIASAGFSQKVKTSAEKGFDLAAYKTFTVEAADLVSVTKEDINKSAIIKGMTETIKSELKSRDYTYQSDSSSELIISFVAEVVDQLNVENVGPLGRQPATRASDIDQSNTWSQESRQGSVAIEIIDRKTRKTIWRSTVTFDFGGNDLSTVLNGQIMRSMRKLPKSKK